ncbi:MULTISPECIES: DGQHR domain-containing protein [Pseudomonas syringae group]|uniref:DGQHR domain-containing protein n=2 Tax=Pseudomonas syringae group TaxID=136849 RepID=A0A3M4WAF4_PSECI|nr:MULTISPECIES: DGQHR domain-containing protein [Pseudomonas]MDO7929197.1 DNA sulfur modification protein DndB [Pseudomonas sp. KFB-138]RMR61036.1 DGQHR domain-containing protein [Pseudomonas cichorii]
MNAKSKLLLPALRGHIGDWIYYTCLIPVSELAARVNYAEEIHQDKALSKLIQRSLEGERAVHISNYLQKTKQRFFNSLVLATYDGNPEWLEVGNFEATSHLADIGDVDQQALETLGFLSLSGAEKIFAVDGQHRLAGIKRAVSEKMDFNGERIPVIFVSHKEAARERTRRLFTTLNKTAKAVKKRDIIALDEDDTMAIIARRLVETNTWFKDPKISVVSSESLPASNRVSLITIAGLYDLLKQIFKHKMSLRSDTQLRFYRPTDRELDNYYRYAVEYFEAIAEAFPPVGQMFNSDEPVHITQQQRGAHGGHVLFRPVGLSIFTTLAIEYANYNGLSLLEAVDRLKTIPTDLAGKPYRDVIWDPVREKMILPGKTLAKDVLRYMAGLEVDTDILRASYAKARGIDGRANLPGRLKIAVSN